MKLYTVTIEAAFMAVAENESAARALIRDFLSTEGIDEDDCHATEARTAADTADGWDGDCLVYGSSDDLTVNEAFRKYT